MVGGLILGEMKMKLSSREQLLKEADEILRKLRKLNEAPKFSDMPKAPKEVDFGKDAKKFAKAYDGGDTKWKSKTMMSKKEAMDIMMQALPDGYNDFMPQLLDKLPSDAKIQLGREGSVCLYVKTNTKPSKASLKADELDEVEPGLYRIWWD